MATNIGTKNQMDQFYIRSFVHLLYRFRSNKLNKGLTDG